MATASTALRNAILDAQTTYIGNAAKLRIYSSTPTLLLEVILGTPFAPGASGGTYNITDPDPIDAVASGDADHAHIYKADGSTLVWSNLTVGDESSSAEVKIMQTGVAIVSGNEYDVTIMTWTAPTGT